MCGIVGLLIKSAPLREQLGALMVPMLIGMTERGPDSAGMAVFTERVGERERKLSLYCATPDFDWDHLASSLRGRFADVTFHRTSNHAILRTTSAPADVRGWLELEHPA